MIGTSRGRLVAVMIGLFLLVSLTVALAASGRLGGGPDTPVGSDDSPRPDPTVVDDPPTAFGEINNFEECAAAGNPVMESYPEQCRTPDGRLFVRVIDQPGPGPSTPNP
ncbi:MAG TPA: hypothetical protein VHL54_04195 [Actinomycetota bacterium]|nr:hypothetical protein [Actinomycetota bacterium]